MPPDQLRADRLRDVTELEHLKYFELESTKRKEFEERQKEIRLTRGRFQDTTIVWQTLEAWQDYRGAVADGWIEIRRNLALREPALATEEQLLQLEADVENFIMVDHDERPKKLLELAHGYQCGAAALEAMAQCSALRDYDMLARARNRMSQLRTEFRQRLLQFQ